MHYHYSTGVHALCEDMIVCINKIRHNALPILDEHCKYLLTHSNSLRVTKTNYIIESITTVVPLPLRERAQRRQMVGMMITAVSIPTLTPVNHRLWAA